MTNDALSDFLAAAMPPRENHASGTLALADSLRAAHPAVERESIYTCATLGDAAGVQSFLDVDRGAATSTGGPFDWNALTYLCFSRYLRLDESRTNGFVRAATLLLDAGASANSGWFDTTHRPSPEWESVLYGAAGLAHRPELTKLLLERGADPNDNDTAYHAPETWDNHALTVLLETRRISADNLVMMLLRKLDYHDLQGAKLVLSHGADPNGIWGPRRFTPLQHALLRDNVLATIALLLDAGADPSRDVEGVTGAARAARCGRRDVLEMLDRRGVSPSLTGVDGLIAACARGDAETVRTFAEREPRVADDVRAHGGDLLARFAIAGNAEGVERLLDLGVPADMPFARGDGYHSIPAGSLAIHAAAWRGRPGVVRVLLEHGSPVDVADAHGQTPLALAVRACVDSYWTTRRSPESVQLLLAAGADATRVPFPSGYADVDALLEEATALSS